MTQHRYDRDPLPVVERGPWLATARGGFWSINSPHPSDVFLEDITVGLSRTCRYGGQIDPDLAFYSVAEHSVLMTEWAISNGLVNDRQDALRILLHDASEAYLGDIPTPLKALIPHFRAIERQAQDAINTAFGLDSSPDGLSYARIKEIDTRIRIDERMVVIREPAQSIGLKDIWQDDPSLKPLGVTISCWDPKVAASRFTALYENVCNTFPEICILDPDGSPEP